MPILIGHRGAPSLAPENTIESLELAQRAGADAVEIDVRTSADGRPVLLHDRTFERLWGSPAAPSELTAAQIADLRVAWHPQAQVPRLEEAARAVDLTLVVDAKDADGVEAIVEDLERADALGRAIFIGDLSVLVAVRAALPEAPIVLSWPQTVPPDTDVLEQVRPRALNLPWEIVDAAAVASVGAQGHEVWTYCVDTTEDARRATELGLVGLISNDVPATRGVVEGAA